MIIPLPSSLGNRGRPCLKTSPQQQSETLSQNLPPTSPPTTTRTHKTMHGTTEYHSSIKRNEVAGHSGSCRIKSHFLPQFGVRDVSQGSCFKLRSRHCTPAWVTGQDSISKKKKKKRKKKNLCKDGPKRPECTLGQRRQITLMETRCPLERVQLS